MTRLDEDLDENRSVWAATAAPIVPCPALTGDITADVVIIGGGFTGISTAYHLIRRFPNKRIVLLEARRIGNGASGRSGGMALNWINGVHAESRDRTLRVFGATLSGLDWIEQTIREHGLSVRFRRAGCLDTFTNAERAEAAHARTERLASWGVPLRYLTGDTLAPHLRAQGVVGAVLDPTAGQLHGLDLLRGLQPLLLEWGVGLFEGSPVVRIDEGKTHVVHTPSGSVRAPVMVLATNAYTARLGYFKNGILPLHSHVIATEPLPLERWRELGWGDTAGFCDDLDRIAYASMTADGRLVFGGGGNGAYSYRYGGRTGWQGPLDDKVAFVRGVLARYFPGAAEVKLEHRWTGPVCATMTRVCSIGVGGEHKNVYHGLGYSGHGVVLANLAGAVLCDLVSDHHEPWRDLPFYQRKLDGIPPEPLRWAGYQVYTRLTGRSPRRETPDD